MPTTEKTVKISSKGQITLPRQFRDILQSDIVRIVADQGLIKIEPVRDAAGSLSHSGRAICFFEKNQGKSLGGSRW